MPQSLRPLRRRVFALFWGAGMVSDIGTWVQLVTIGSLVAGTTGKATATGLVAAATFGPQGLASPLGGLLADRHDRRRILIVSLGAQTLLTLVLAVLLARGERNPNVLSLVVLVQSGSGSLGQPSFSAIIPGLVPRDELLAANSLLMMSWNAGRVVGPLLAGLAALLHVGPAWAIGLNALSFFVMWLAVLAARRPFPPAERVRRAKRHELIDGARALWRTPGCRLSLSVIIGLHFTTIPFMGLIPYFARHVLHGDTRTTALLTSAQGIAAVVAALSIPGIVARHGRPAAVRASMLAMSATTVLYFTSTTMVQALIGVALLGGSTLATISLLSSMNQRDAPIEHRGRIFSLYSAGLGTSYGIGLWLFGVASDHFGARAPFLAGGAVLAVAAVALGASADVRRTLLGDDPPHARPARGR